MVVAVVAVVAATVAVVATTGVATGDNSTIESLESKLRSSSRNSRAATKTFGAGFEF